MKFIVDTGSPVNFIRLRDFCGLGHTKSDIGPASKTVSGITGHKMPVLGEATISVIHQEKVKSLNVILTNNGPNILGLEGLRSLGVQCVFNVASSCNPCVLTKDVQRLIVECSSAVGGIKINPVRLEIVANDPCFFKARPMALGLRQPVKKILDELEAAGILTMVSTSQWATPIVTPIKANGQPRVCGDYRITVNKFLKQASSTTPDVEEMFADLSGSKIFSKIDLQNAFLQIPIDDQSKSSTLLGVCIRALFVV